MKTNASIYELNQALNYVNQKFDDNIKFKAITPIGKKVQFTLTVHDSKNPGSRRSAKGRRIAAACWHVHGYFFEYLFNNFDNITISAGKKVMKDNSDNWQDWQIGNNYRPLMYSEACEC